MTRMIIGVPEAKIRDAALDHPELTELREGNAAIKELNQLRKEIEVLERTNERLRKKVEEQAEIIRIYAPIHRRMRVSQR